VAVGALERGFYQQLLVGLGLDGEQNLPDQMDRTRWQALRARFAEVFASRTRAEWTGIFGGLDACVSPVLAPREVADADHTRARAGFVEISGVLQPAPATRFSRTPAPTPTAPRIPGEDTKDVLVKWSLGMAASSGDGSQGKVAGL
jgi:alpha-methylacyl-CoA racemase